MGKHAKQLQEEQKKQQRLNQIKIITVVIIALAIVGYWFSRSRVPVPQEISSKTLSQTASSDWIKGNPNAKVVVVEYADFQCPACAAYHPLVAELAEVYGNQVAFAYRHFPLKQIHFQAELASQAAEAAGMQGKFWEMHHLLYSRQQEWAEKRNAKEIFARYAEEIGLNMDQYNRDLNSTQVKAKVKGDYFNALSHNLSGTPSFFLQGQKLENPANLEAFKTLLNQALINAGEATPSAQTQSDEEATASASQKSE